MDEARAAESLSRIQDEINAEKAAALSRIAGTLEGLLAELRRIAAEAASAASRERERSVARHQEVREQALRYRWYLEVQREAIGLTGHEALDALYPVPPPLDGDGFTPEG
jgi:hypothetical protein